MRARNAHPHTPPTASGGLTRFAYERAMTARIDLNSILKAADLTHREIEDRDARLIVRDQIKFLNLVAVALKDDFLEQHIRAVRDPGRKADSYDARKHSPAPPPTDTPSNEEEPKRPAERWSGWWQRFRAQFLGADPENQVAQVYHITAGTIPG